MSFSEKTFALECRMQTLAALARSIKETLLESSDDERKVQDAASFAILLVEQLQLADEQIAEISNFITQQEAARIDFSGSIVFTTSATRKETAR